MRHPLRSLAGPALALLGLLAARAALAEWSATGVALCTRLSNEYTPAIASDEAGGAVMCWQDSRNLAYGFGPDLYAQRVDGAGGTRWTNNGVIVAKTAGTQALPRVASDGLGGAFIVWWDDREGAGPASLYATRVTDDGTIASGWPANGLAVASRRLDSSRYAIVPDGAGGAYVAWEDSTRLPGIEIVVQRLTATGAPAPGWPADGLGVAPLSTDQFEPDLVADGAGGVYVAWTDATANAAQSNIRLQRVGAGGALAPGWPAAGLSIVSAVNAQTSPRLVSDVAGGAILAWIDARASANQVIYAQRVTAAGTALWAGQGVAVSAARHPTFTLRASSDGAGGAHLLWADQRLYVPLSTAYIDLYAQRVTAAGTIAPGWNPGGTGLCTQLNSYRDAAGVVQDGAGGAYYVWTDARAGNCPVYTNHLSATGAVEADGAVNGIPLLAINSTAANPGLIRPRFGGAIVGFNDNRQAFGTNYNVYAVRLGTAALVDAEGAPPAGGFGIERIAPNPARGAPRVSLALEGDAPATLEVFDPQGRRVRALALAGGTRRAVADLGGSPALAPGVYAVRLRQGARVATKRAVVIR